MHWMSPTRSESFKRIVGCCGSISGKVALCCILFRSITQPKFHGHLTSVSSTSSWIDQCFSATHFIWVVNAQISWKMLGNDMAVGNQCEAIRFFTECVNYRKIVTQVFFFLYNNYIGWIIWWRRCLILKKNLCSRNEDSLKNSVLVNIGTWHAIFIYLYRLFKVITVMKQCCKNARFKAIEIRISEIVRRMWPSRKSCCRQVVLPVTFTSKVMVVHCHVIIAIHYAAIKG